MPATFVRGRLELTDGTVEVDVVSDATSDVEPAPRPSTASSSSHWLT
jgi:hypothetical protein